MPQLLGRLSELAMPLEAQRFQELAERIKSASQAHHWHDESAVLKSLQAALRKALGSPVTVGIKGSLSKGTQTHSSDIDVLVNTHDLPISHKEKQEVVKHLCDLPMIHQSHITLKRLAIGCIIHGTNVDLVFSSTAEYGDLPVDLEPCTPHTRVHMRALCMPATHRQLLTICRALHIVRHRLPRQPGRPECRAYAQGGDLKFGGLRPAREAAIVRARDISA
jgi:predicted nucleotidyltransferase